MFSWTKLIFADSATSMNSPQLVAFSSSALYTNTSGNFCPKRDVGMHGKLVDTFVQAKQCCHFTYPFELDRELKKNTTKKLWLCCYHLYQLLISYWNSRTYAVTTNYKGNTLYYNHHDTINSMHFSDYREILVDTLIARFMRPTWGPSGSCRPQMDPMVAPWNLAIRVISFL